MSFKVSIIIPAYNASNYITDAIQSALNQTWENKEIIIVDDGSTDDTLQKAMQFASHNVKVHTQQNKGACAARNKGFELSTGEYIQYLDADDILALDKIEQQMKYFDGTGNDSFIVNGRWAHFDKDYKIEKLRFGPHESLQKDLSPIDWLLANHMSTTPSWLCPRNLILKNGPWDESLKVNQDGDFFTRLVSISTEVKYCEKANIYYRRTNSNYSVTKNYNKPEGVESYFKTLEKFHKIVLNLDDSERSRTVIANKYMDFVFRYYPDFNIYTDMAINKVKSLGSYTVKPKGGFYFNLLVNLLGWKLPLFLKRKLR
jgi:glycosyltransferase involved in cell wall biosynthesis